MSGVWVNRNGLTCARSKPAAGARGGALAHWSAMPMATVRGETDRFSPACAQRLLLELQQSLQLRVAQLSAGVALAGHTSNGTTTGGQAQNTAR